MTAVEEFAPAKVNLTLHVTGRRTDGYHLLDSLVVFADVGDRLLARPAPSLSLSVDGPRAAGVPVDGGNLVLAAAQLMDGPGAALTLTKHLPAAAGIGGGSADAAAALRALSRLWNQPLPNPERILSLGADIPACLAGRALRMSGVGEALEPVAGLAPLPAVLANPGIAVSTPAVFAALASRHNAPMQPLPASRDPDALIEWLKAQRNDLEQAAIAIAPPIAGLLAALRAQTGCRMARMSGSGATCFALFGDAGTAAAAAAGIARAQPGWWVVPSVLS
ncbi:4-(cytidine 5'-diphospho)-2-C-methyl-D-erythritol kinase [Tropicimonas sp.]|uniref:4-(cytidine 5'-diphospho)-2-C-methyl-D-erythritol kinase n=1 Tax=Tropicimonas sp. TaxID=2067044 RepID=UPI003A87C4D7